MLFDIKLHLLWKNLHCFVYVSIHNQIPSFQITFENINEMSRIPRFHYRVYCSASLLNAPIECQFTSRNGFLIFIFHSSAFIIEKLSKNYMKIQSILLATSAAIFSIHCSASLRKPIEKDYREWCIEILSNGKLMVEAISRIQISMCPGPKL